jgi:hypothetical protein
MGDRSESHSESTQVRIKVFKKDECWSVGLVYDLRELSGVTTARPRVAGVLQMVLESNLTISLVHTGQLRRMR